MAKRKLDNLEDQAARLNQRALALKNKGTKARIDKMLKARPDLHSGVIQHLVGMGCSDDGPAVGPAHELPPAAQSPKAALTEKALQQLAARGSSLKQDISKSSNPSSSTKSSTLGYPASMHGSQVAASCFSMEEMALVTGNKKKLEDYVPRCHMTYEAMSPMYFQYIIAKLEPSSLSLAGQKALCTGKNKHVPKTALLEIFQFITGVAVEADLKPDMHYLPYFVSILMQANEARGRPAQGMVLPPAWSLMGIYRVTEEDDKLKLTHTILKETVDLPADFAAKVNIKDVVIDKNYSEHQATLVRGYMRFACNNAFPHAQYKLVPTFKPLKDWVSERGQQAQAAISAEAAEGADKKHSQEAAEEAAEESKAKALEASEPALDESSIIPELPDESQA